MAPVDSSPNNLSQSSSFELVCSSQANDLISVRKFRSSRTGLTVVLADVDGPVVNGYFCLATEALDDDGLPHTLEHLIFLGSEKYPFKGVLDLLANRCLASGTNAWTDTDHTCYTMTTVGSEGFLSLMPIYLDHILYPTLNDSGFLTEVHHITGEGEDGGVVYCEMQGRENTGESLCHLAMLRKLYPNCGYSSETGGIMHNLRTSTDNVKVRAYHKQFYRPENLTLIVTGKVSSEDVFKALAPLEDKICSKGDRGSFTRPWQSDVAALEASIDNLVKYPSDEEDNGMVYVAWRGPSAVNELYKMCACSVLLKYLTETAVSPLQRDLVEISDPYASKVGYNLIENSVSALYIEMENVPIAKLDTVKNRMDEILAGIMEEKEALDMSRLRTVINKQILESLSHLEKNPHDSVAFMAIGDMLYGQSICDLDQRLNTVRDLRKLLEEPSSFWLQLLGKYLGPNAPSVTMRGSPSCILQQEMAKEEETRIQEQRKKLGETGLAEAEKTLITAMETNEIPPPEEMLTSVPIPSTSGINFHSIESFTSAQSEVSHPAFSDLSIAGVTMHLDNLRTNFVYLFVLMDTNEVSSDVRPYLPLLLETILESPVQRGDELVSYETVVAELEADTLSATTAVGLEPTSRFSCGPYGQSVMLALQLEPGKYARGVHWLQELLYHSKFTSERLLLVAAKMINDVAQAKRKGNTVAGDILKGMMYGKESNQHCSSMIRQHAVLSELTEALKAGGESSEQVLQKLEKLRAHLTKPGNMVVHLAANLEALEEPALPWSSFLPSHLEHQIKPLNVTPDWTLLEEKATDRGCIVGLGCVESAFLKHCCPGLKGFQHEDLAAVLVFMQYLTQLEGPLWKQVRGQGLAYSYNMFPCPNDGMIYFTLYRATNVIAAFNESKNIVENQLKPDAVWETSLLDSARSSLVYEVVEKEKSVGDVVAQSLLSYFKGVSHNYNKELVQHILAVTEADLRRVGPQHVAPLFKPGAAFTSIVCHPSKTEEVATAFNQIGYPMKIAATLEGSPLGPC